jgi:uracil-DNA glycosylase family 4
MKYTLPPEGPLDARIAVVCEKPATDEVTLGRILVGASGSRVRNHLKIAGLHAGNNKELSKEVWLTNAVQSFDDPRANPTDAQLTAELPRLYRELAQLPRLTTIIGMGAVALKALSNYQYSDITHRRGSRLASALGVKFVPTFHPAFYMRGEWRFAPVVQFDINRAVGESTWKEIRHKHQRKYHIRPESSTQALMWLSFLKANACSSGYLSFDIETSRGAHGTWYITCIALSIDPTEAFCIPLTRKDRTAYWPNISTESLIWRELAAILNLDGVKYITQNGCAFDGHQLRKHGIVLEKMNDGFDTFSAHSLLAPDLPHDLGFLVSIYTDEEYYKDESGRSEYLSGNASEDLYWTYNCKDAALTLECAFGIMADLKEN